jgi:hypothetical protein
MMIIVRVVIVGSNSSMNIGPVALLRLAARAFTTKMARATTFIAFAFSRRLKFDCLLDIGIIARLRGFVRMLGPRLTSRGDVDPQNEERGRSTPSRLPGRNK